MIRSTRSKMPRRVLLALTCIAIITGCASFERPNRPAAVPEIRPGVLAGYLSPTALPDSLSLLPAPPAAGSVALALDEEVHRTSLAVRGTPRWQVDGGCGPDLSARGRHVRLRAERAHHGAGDTAALHAAAPQPHRCERGQQQGEGYLQAGASVRRTPGTHLQPGGRKEFTAEWLVPVRAHHDRLDLGPRPQRDCSRADQCHPCPRPGVRTEPVDL